MDVLWNWFIALPETAKASIVGPALGGLTAVFGAAIAACLALLGVWRTNKAHENRLTVQLDADRDAKRTEREMTIKKEVYLEAFTAVGSVVSTISSSFGTDASRLTTEFAAHSAKISKLHLVASEETLRVVASFTGASTAAMFSILPERLALDQIRTALKSCAEHRNYVVNDRQRNLDRYMESNPQLLNQLFTVSSSEHEKINSEIRKLEITQADKVTALTKLCVQQSKRLSSIVLPLLVSMRKDLDTSIDGPEYERMMTKLHSEGFSDLEGLIEHFTKDRRQSEAY